MEGPCSYKCLLRKLLRNFLTSLCVTFSTISLLYAQLQGQVMSHEMTSTCSCHDILGLRGQQAMENMTQSLCCFAQHLFKQVSLYSVL